MTHLEMLAKLEARGWKLQRYSRSRGKWVRLDQRNLGRRQTQRVIEYSYKQEFGVPVQ